MLCPGDLFIWAVPNDGNPQKVQRYPWDRAKGLREMAANARRYALCPGHGGPVIGESEKIVRMLTETADFLDIIVSRTLAAMEAGSPPHVDIVTGVELPKSDSPWLQPVYDDTEFIVRNVIRFYGGWWSGRPSESEARAARRNWRVKLHQLAVVRRHSPNARRSSRSGRFPPCLPSCRLRAGSRTRRCGRAGKSRRDLRRARRDRNKA